ncbi:TrmJ/YjtD family RNA methyltransferase [Pelagibacteraceae bacterium]|jgi:tRNA/rRNA methyltransferase|nr:TrmJ/YjtD family RNA methyltransferase [Pelagibacteraceae bacterium]
MSLKNSYFILCRPQLGENIGSSARALKNFNIPNLRIVNPRCAWPNQKAKATSVGAKNIIQSAKIFKSIEESIGDLDIIFASTSRSRKVNKKIVSITEFTKKIKKNKKIGIVFGPEASGLTNDEVNCADYLVTIPTNKEFSSLNLSHSLILFCFQMFKHFSKKKFNFISGYKSNVASKSEVNKFLTFIIKGLDKKGFLQPEHKRQSMIRNINNIFHRLNLSEQEIRILLGIFTTLNGFNNKS